MATHDMNEIWKPVTVTGFEALYAVSDRGRVRRIAPGGNSFVGRILKPSLDRGGYVRLCLGGSSRKIRRTYTAHQLVMLAFVGPPLPGQQVNHLNGNRADNRLSNLEWATRSEDMQHKSKVLGSGRGSTHPGAKLTRTDVIEMRRLYATGAWSYAALAKRYEVTGSAIAHAITKSEWGSWQHIA